MIYYNILYPIFLSIWRRCFGCSGWDIPILKNRFFQHVLGFIGLFGLLYLNEISIVQNILACLVFQGLFWARSHGCCFDYGHGVVDLKRYDQLWYWKYVKKVIPQNEWYSFTGDYILMTVRYTLPAILISMIIINPYISFIGVVLSSTYAICWKLYDWKYVNNPTVIAEWLSGLFVGLMLIG